MTVAFQRATKKQAKLRMAIDGPSGSGKTFTGLVAAFALAPNGKVAVIDTEHGSASKYADIFPAFDVLELDSFHPQKYIDGVSAAEAGGYDVILIDSLSHAWEGEGGVLDLHDQATKRSQSGNSFTAWKDITPIQRKLVESMLQSSCHIIATMRSKMEYIQTTDDRGKSIIKKVGLAPVQRQGMEYEFDVFGDMDLEHNLVITKTRCHLITDAIVNKPTAAWFETLRIWLTDGAAVPIPQPVAPKPAVTAATTAPVTQAAMSAQGNGHPRPYDAAYLKERFPGLVSSQKTDPVKPEFAGLVASWLELCFIGQGDVDQKRHSLVRYLTGKTSLHLCTPQELRGFKFWLAPEADSGGAFKISSSATQEAQRVITQVMLEAGQGTLPLDAPPAEEAPNEEIPF